MQKKTPQLDYLARDFVTLREARKLLPAANRPAYELMWRWTNGIPLRDGTTLSLRVVRRGPNRLYTRPEWLNQFLADYDAATQAGKLDRRRNRRIRRSRTKSGAVK